MFSPAGKWQKCYKKVKVMGKSCVTEISELQCAIGGKITLLKHGQQSEATKTHVRNADAREQQVYNPLVDFEEFQDGFNEDEEYE
ncbi:PAAR-like protein [Chryseobacterium sp. TY3]